MTNAKEQAAQGEPRLIPLTKWNDFHAWPTVGGLRYLVRHAAKNGFGACIVRPMKLVLIDEAAFFRWLESKREGRPTT